MHAINPSQTFECFSKTLFAHECMPLVRQISPFLSPAYADFPPPIHFHSCYARELVGEHSYLAYKRYRHGVSLSATSFASRNSSKSFPFHFPRWVTYLRDLSVRETGTRSRRLRIPFSCPRPCASHYLTIDTAKSRSSQFSANLRNFASSQCAEHSRVAYTVCASF